ncbi:MAG: hypothetical protein NZ932_06230 [Candidatus Bathyarchaeota archaeon]|nr:hypothetical protein [Candidatus Bathyarchaeota archaeon]MDW8040397.1 hypothetical protein [Nitrososphaerota archaeon]
MFSQGPNLKILQKFFQFSPIERKTFKEPVFHPNFGDGYAKEEEGRKERGKEGREEIETFGPAT